MQLVRVTGVEPACLAALDPKLCKVMRIFIQINTNKHKHIHHWINTTKELSIITFNNNYGIKFIAG